MHHQNNWITLPWVILSWLTSQICANCGPAWKQRAHSFLGFTGTPVWVSLVSHSWLWLILVSNKWKGHLLVTARLSDLVKKWESSGMKCIRWASLEASFGDASHYISVIVLMSLACLRSRGRRISATFCLRDTMEPFLPWYFHNVFLQGPVYTYACSLQTA